MHVSKSSIENLNAWRIYLSVVLQGEIEGKPRDTLSFSTCRNLQALNYTREALVLKARVFAFCVFTNDGEVDIIMSGWETR